MSATANKRTSSPVSSDRDRMSASGSVRTFAAVALLLVACAVVLMIVRSGGGTTIHATFENAGGLVEGGSVRVAGRKIGTISNIGLTPAGQADVKLEIDEAHTGILREGVRAAIRAVGQAGVANSYVQLVPGPATGATLRDGAVLPSTKTAGMVSIDAVLDSFDPSLRADLQDLIANSAQVYAGSGSRYFNRVLAKLDPALGEIYSATGDLASDRAALDRFVRTAAAAASAVGSRSGDLRSAVSNTARSMNAVALERGALDDLLRRAPAVLGQARGTLVDLTGAVSALRPTLRAVPAAAGPLDTFLRRLEPTLGAATPVVKELTRQVPGLRRSLAGFVPLRRRGVNALNSSRDALRDSMHILNGFRIYSPDLLVGVLNGLVSIAAGPYDHAGQYAHAEFAQPPQTFLGGASSGLFSSNPIVPGFFEIKTKQLSRCPGAIAPPAPDGSNPWIPDPSLCDPSQNVSSAVNEP